MRYTKQIQCVGIALLGAAVHSCGWATSGAVAAGSSSSGGSPAPFFQEGVEPRAFQEGVDPLSPVRVRFSKAIDELSVSADQLSLRLVARDEPINGSISISQDGMELIFEPTEGLNLLADYEVVLRAGVISREGDVSSADFAWSFSTRDGGWSQPELIDAELSADDLRFVEDQAVVVLLEDTLGGRLFRTARFDFAKGWAAAREIPGAMGHLERGHSYAESANGTAALTFAGLQIELSAVVFDPVVNSWGEVVVLEQEGLGQRVFFEDVHTPQMVFINEGAIWGRQFLGSGWGDREVVGITAPRASASLIGFGSDDVGLILSAWSEDGLILVNRFSQESRWQSPEVVVDTGLRDLFSGTSFAVAPTGAASVLWVAEQVFDVRLEPEPGTWSVQVVNQGAACDGELQSPFIVMGPEGSSLAIWDCSLEGEAVTFVNRFTPGLNWGTAITLADPGAAPQDPFLAVDRVGNAVAVWAQTDNIASGQLWWRRFRPGAGWSAAAVLVDTPGCPEVPKAAFDDRGRCVVTWRERADCQSAGPFWGSFSARFE